MKVKQWIVSGDNQDDVVVGRRRREEAEVEIVLRIGWNPRKGSFKFFVRINLSSLRKKPGGHLTMKELLWNSPLQRPVTEDVVQFVVSLYELKEIDFY